MASAASVKTTAAICCIMLILTMGQLMADAASPRQGSRHLLQFAGVEASNRASVTPPGTAPGTSQGLKNAPVRNTVESPATRRVRINGPPN
ncbi:unnamed protein product [Urochloa decumbens]|uniref:Uncharacterized protein n=1 Tax=Urochloa decumbens TaxID=240449 RepID=A0ABC9ASV8_9POAL